MKSVPTRDLVGSEAIVLACLLQCAAASAFRETGSVGVLEARHGCLRTDLDANRNIEKQNEEGSV